MTLLFLASAALVLWEPHTTRMLSYWLSFVASAALITRLPADGARGWTASAKAIGSGVLFAYLATLPIVLSVFGTWSISAVVANAILSPLMLVAFPLSFMLGFVLLIAPHVAGHIAWIPAVVLETSLFTVRGLSEAVSPLEFRTTGWVGILPVGMLCIMITLGFSQDGRRWMMLIVQRWEASRVTLIVLGLASLAGAVTGVALALLR